MESKCLLRPTVYSLQTLLTVQNVEEAQLMLATGPPVKDGRLHHGR